MSYYVMTTKRASQVRGDMTRWPPLSPGVCRWPQAGDEFMDSRTVHWVTFSVTCRTSDRWVFNPISSDQLTCRHRKPLMVLTQWTGKSQRSKLVEEATNRLTVLLFLSLKMVLIVKKINRLKWQWSVTFGYDLESVSYWLWLNWMIVHGRQIHKISLEFYIKVLQDLCYRWF